MRKYIIAAVCVLLCGFGTISAQHGRDDFMEFYKQRGVEFNKFKEDRAKANAEFTEFLRQAWQEFLVKAGKTDPIGPVPDKPVYYGEQPAPSGGMHGLPSSSFAVPAPAPVYAISASYTEGRGVVDIDFFGLHKSVPFSASMKLPRVTANESAVSQGWASLSDSDYFTTVEALDALRSEHSLSDWAVYTIIKQMTDQVYVEEYINEKILTQMFLLTQLGYRARVGSAGNDLILLLPFDGQIYRTSYISDENNTDYYIFGYTRLNSQTPLYTFTEDYPEAVDKLNLVIDTPMKMPAELYRVVPLNLWSKILGEEVTVPICLTGVSFTLDYPLMDLEAYHHSAVDSETSKAILRAVKYRILKDDMNQAEAVSFILNLVQKGFAYKTDYEMFGRSKPLFIEESLYYGENNCKDRVLIFSWLVRETVGLETVMAGYQGHVACGVKFTVPVTGDKFTYKGVEYTMCDPTYIGAPVGATMPQFRDVSPNVIEI